MSEPISCSCGYRGPGRAEAAGIVCPLCGEQAATGDRKKWRIPCPNGHVFNVVEEWIGKQLVCPKCNAPFVPWISDSYEKREEARRRQEREETKFARRWLTRSIWAAVLFGLMMISLLVVSLMRW